MNITPSRWFYEYLINYTFGAGYMYEYYDFGASYINIMPLGWNIWILCLQPGYMNIMSSGQAIWKLSSRQIIWLLCLHDGYMNVIPLG